MREKLAHTRPVTKLLILWGGANAGHLHVAESIAAECTGYPVILKDVMELQNPLTRKFITASYDFMTKHTPKTYDDLLEKALKNAADIPNIADLPSTKLYRPQKVLEYIKTIKPTHILSTFSPATEVLAHLRHHGELKKIACGQVLTDYFAAKYFSRLGELLDITFSPHPHHSDELHKLGLETKKIVSSGIPIDFAALKNIAAQDSFLHEQGLDPKHPLIVFISGAAGTGDMPLWVRSSITALQSREMQLVAICGRNKSNERKLKRLKVPSSMKLQVKGFIPREAALALLKNATAVVTKPGGITVTELAHLGKAAVLVDVSKGQERYNAEFFEHEGLSLTTSKQSEVGELVKRLLDDQHVTKRINKAQSYYRANIESSAILKWISKN
jgi:UDP-N-acetylglucosamine:LPS N-acetylglucosamine transferase